MDAKQLEKMMGFAPGELKKAAEAYAKAKRHGQTRTERLRELITLDAMIA